MKERTSCGNFSAQILEFSLHAVFSPFLQEISKAVRYWAHKKTDDIQLKIDKQVSIFCLLDCVYRFYMSLPTGEIPPLFDRAGFEELYDRTSSV